MNTVFRHHVTHTKTDLTLIAQREKAGETELKAVLFGIHEKYSGEKVPVLNDAQLERYAEQLRLFLDGKIHTLGEIALCFEGYSAFQKSVLVAARKISWGTTVSYKKLAAMSGNTGAVRAVASVMRNNPFPLIIPCHRVIKSDGTIGGFAGQKDGAMVMLKKTLLEQEGIWLV